MGTGAGGATITGVTGNFGGGAGGGDGTAGEQGGFGGGGGGSTDGTRALGGFGGGTGADSSTANGGGGGALGGAVFVQHTVGATGGVLNVVGAFTINGSHVTAGSALAGGTAGSAAGSGIFLQGDGALVFAPASGTTATIADTIADESGSGGTGSWQLSKIDGGTLVLSGANTYSGNTSINGGTLSVSSDANLGLGSVEIDNGATLAITASGSFLRAATLGGNAAIAVSAGQTATWSGSIADVEGPGTLNVTGGGALALTNATNSYSGGTFVAGGSTLRIGQMVCLARRERASPWAMRPVPARSRSMRPAGSRLRVP